MVGIGVSVNNSESLVTHYRSIGEEIPCVQNAVYCIVVQHAVSLQQTVGPENSMLARIVGGKLQRGQSRQCVAGMIKIGLLSRLVSKTSLVPLTGQ